ncbi:hypothetical protein [Methanoregula sp.]|uniref:hypothetical protein n=1 Tax=Methanoregula sp. TaxID=2052170 RepID=UPI00236B2702|nr:hypothetical protein [Methanoregula sp.]MDD1686998.1 hypothetical protein [Methanoregula sp.]
MKSGRAAIMVILICAACLALPAAAAVYYSASTPQIITKGDTFSVSGTGAVNGTVALWVIGRDHFEVRTVAPDRHGNFSLLFKSTETMKFSSGQYAIVFQDPGPSGTMEIESGHDSTGNITLMNRGKIIARFGSEKNLKGNVEEETHALTSSAILQGVDDTFLTEYFFVEEPAVHFNEIIPASGSRLPDKISGNQIRITGTTNMGTDDLLVAEIRNADTNNPVTSKKIPVLSGSSLNRWSYVLDEPGLEPGNYNISVGWTITNSTGTGTALFSVRGETTPVPPSPTPILVMDDVPLPKGLDTLLILGMIFVFAVIVYTVTKK